MGNEERRRKYRLDISILKRKELRKEHWRFIREEGRDNVVCF